MTVLSGSWDMGLHDSSASLLATGWKVPVEEVGEPHQACKRGHQRELEPE